MFFYSRTEKGKELKNCTWKCGGKTKNRTGICDDCWRNREAIYVARKAKEAATEKKPLSAARKTALEKLNVKEANPSEEIPPARRFLSRLRVRPTFCSFGKLCWCFSLLISLH
jgi:predicted amidophosphoribosyltransferase